MSTITNNQSHLTTNQIKGLDEIVNNQFVFVTGVAGSGKSYLVNYYTKKYCENKCVAKVAFMALTAKDLPKDKENDIVGTIHSVFKINNRGTIKPNVKPEYGDIKNIFSKIDVLVIEEISMVRIDLFEYLIKLIDKANKYRSNPIQIIFVGDFYQLPPIVTDSDKKLLNKYYNTIDGYCFESRYWSYLPIKTVYLDLNIRSGQDKEFDYYLNNIKDGKDLNKTLSYFNKQVKDNLKPQAGVVELYATNNLVNKVNKQCLKKLDGKQIKISAYYDDEVLLGIKNGKIDKKNLPFELSLSLKPNAQVMFTINDKIIDNKQRFVNGDIATVISCKKDEVVVRLWKNNELVHLHHYNCGYQLYKSNGDMYCGQFKQYPLKLAYAMTIHKAQGKTFNKINLNPESDYDLTPGQIYVALSRVKSIQDICLYSPLSLKHISMNKKVIDFYDSLDHDKIMDKLFGDK